MRSLETYKMLKISFEVKVYKSIRIRGTTPNPQRKMWGDMAYYVPPSKKVGDTSTTKLRPCVHGVKSEISLDVGMESESFFLFEVS